MVQGEYREIPLTQGKVALVSPEDFERTTQYKWHALKCSRPFERHTQKWYGARRGPNDGKIYMHRLIMDAPQGMVVDHIDGNGLNNTRGNLRLVTQEENTKHCRYRPTHRCDVDPYL